MSSRKAALNICAAAAVLAFALGVRGDDAAKLTENQGFTHPPPEFVLTSRDAADILVGRASGDLDFRQWLAARRVRFYEGAEDAFAGVLAERAARLPFVRRARVELQTSLGGRKGAGGVDVAGALRESDDDIVGWQLRGYAAEHGSKGLNTGLFYRRVVGGALAGVNVFADYEDGDDGDFWRWSVGGDVKNRLGELSANRYFAITDAQVVGGENVYTREGYDVDFAVRIPRLEWAKARVGYYNFKGEFGDEDENGFRAGLDLSPGAGLVVGVEYDDDDGKFGGNISYTHNFGETSRGAQRAGEFNPRAHFYDAVRREYSQRITRASGGANGFVIVTTAAEVIVTNAMAAVTTAVTVTAEAANSVFAFADTVNIVKADGAAVLKHQGDAWTLALSATAATIEFYGGTVMNVIGGMGTFERSGGNLTMIRMGGVTITLLGTHFDFEVNGGNVNITLREGGLGIPASGVNVEVADSASVVVNNTVVHCGNDETAARVTGKCEIADATSESVMTEVTEGGGANVLIGRITLAGADADISASVSPSAEFSAVKNGAIINVNLLAAAAMTADRNVKIARVNVRGGELQTAREFMFTVRVNPQAINLMFVGGNSNTAPLTMPGDITVGTLEVTNGFGAQNITFDGANGDFSLEASDAANRRLLILGGNNTQAREVSVVVRGDDNVNRTDAALLSVTVMVVERVLLNGGGRYSVYAVNAESMPIVIFEPAGGTPPYGMQVAVEPSNVPAGFSRQNNISATITRTTDNAVGGMEHEFIQEISETRTNGDTARATATITVIAPLSLGINYKTGGGVLDIGMRQTVATIGAASGGLGGYQFTRETPSGVSYVDGTIIVAQLDNATTVSFNVVVDDRENGNAVAITPPYTLDIALSTTPPLTIGQISITVTTGSAGSRSTHLWTVQAQGGVPPYRYGFFRQGSFRESDGSFLVVPPDVVITPGPVVSVLYRDMFTARSAPGMRAQDYPIAVQDSSTPRRVFMFPSVTVHFVLPPPVTISVDQTVNSTPAGASSVAVATLTYTGGSTGGALTATVVGVKDGFGSVSDNEVLMSASAAGEVIATINAYDSANSTAPNATAQITVNFTGGG